MGESHFDPVLYSHMLNSERAMSRPTDQKQIAFNYGQLHGLKALVRALVRTHPDCALLLKEFQRSGAVGLDQLRASPVPHGANQAYRQLCDEFIVVIGRNIQVARRPRSVP